MYSNFDRYLELREPQQHSEQSTAALRNGRLHPPQLPGDVLLRSRLFERLDRTEALTCVIAPAGFGKTTLAASWLPHSVWPSCWVTLGADNSNLVTFLTDVVTAIRSLFPCFANQLLPLLQAPLPLSPATVLPTLLREFSLLDHEFVLVFDDFHAVSDPAVHQLLAGLMAYPPAAMHAVLCSRYDPPIPPRVRLAANVGEVRMYELGFTAQEAEALLSLNGERSLSPQVVAAAIEYAEGWATPLRLVATMVQHGYAVDSVECLVRANRHHLTFFLASKVIDCLPAATQAFLELTSVFPRLNSELCTAVLGTELPASGDNQMLRSLETAGLFLAALDEAGEWYCYHCLFRSLMEERLRRKRSCAEIEQLQHRLIAWFEDNGYWDDALRQAVTLVDKAMAIGIMAKYRPQLMAQAEYRRIEEWCGLFSLDVVSCTPEILLARAWLCVYVNDLAGVQTNCLRAKRATPPLYANSERTFNYQAEIDALTGYCLLVTADASGAIAAAEQALRISAPDQLYVRTAASTILALALQMTGQSEQAQRVLAILRNEADGPCDLLEARFTFQSCCLQLFRGDLAALRTGATKLLALTPEWTLAEMKSWRHYLLGCACYWQNDLAEARMQFACVFDNPYDCSALVFVDSACGLALAYQGLHQPDQAAAVLARVQEYARTLNNEYILLVVEACSAELALRQGRLDIAMGWRRQHLTPSQCGAMLALYNSALTESRILLLEHTDQGLADAACLLDNLRVAAFAQRHVRLQVEVCALQAILYQQQGSPALAQSALELALELAAPGNQIRPFVDASPAINPLLAETHPRPALMAFVARVRSMVESETAYAAPGPGVMPQPSVTSDLRNLQEILTFREMDVLLLLGKRLSNLEIASALNISLSTAKTHCVKIYRKLGVSNRREAIIYAAKAAQSAK